MELLKRASAQLRRWRDLLRKFLKNEEDQVELLLTLEEFCAEEGDFEGTGERGAYVCAWVYVDREALDAHRRW